MYSLASAPAFTRVSVPGDVVREPLARLLPRTRRAFHGQRERVEHDERVAHDFALHDAHHLACEALSASSCELTQPPHASRLPPDRQCIVIFTSARADTRTLWEREGHA